jgi:hypothetical protein
MSRRGCHGRSDVDADPSRRRAKVKRMRADQGGRGVRSTRLRLAATCLVVFTALAAVALIAGCGGQAIEPPVPSLTPLASAPPAPSPTATATELATPEPVLPMGTSGEMSAAKAPSQSSAADAEIVAWNAEDPNDGILLSGDSLSFIDQSREVLWEIPGWEENQDQDGTLWYTHSYTSDELEVLDPDGTYGLANADPAYLALMIAPGSGVITMYSVLEVDGEDLGWTTEYRIEATEEPSTTIDLTTQLVTGSDGAKVVGVNPDDADDVIAIVGDKVAYANGKGKVLWTVSGWEEVKMEDGTVWYVHYFTPDELASLDASGKNGLERANPAYLALTGVPGSGSVMDYWVLTVDGKDLGWTTEYRVKVVE